ncbi:MAG: hypothetical protein ABI877_23750, partial [Gemmatimonadaceae bacterium]
MFPLSGGAGARFAAYVVATVATAAIAVLALGTWFAPSFLVAKALRPGDPPDVRVLRACVIAFVLQPVVHALILWIGGRNLSPDSYRLASFLSQGALLCAVAPLRLGVPTGVTAKGWGKERTALVFGFLIFVTAILLPRLVWQDLNPDGTELLTMGRSLASHAFARLPTGEIPGISLGMVTIAY